MFFASLLLTSTMSRTSTSSTTSTTSTGSVSSSTSVGTPNGQKFVVPRGPKFFSKPQLVIFRFLDVIKSKHNLAVEMLSFARRNLQDFLARHWDQGELQDLIEELRNQSLEDKTGNDQTPEIFSPPQTVQGIRDSLLIYVSWKTATERNRLDLGHDSVPLQKLVHWVVLEGIIEDTIKFTIPENFVTTFRHIQSRSVPQMVFSSAVSQVFPGRRLLSNTDHGDLSTYFLYFDLPTETRAKETYVQLAKQFNFHPSEILLVAFSDTECKKAARAGFRVAKIKQVGQGRPKYPNITVVNDLSEIRLKI